MNHRYKYIIISTIIAGIVSCGKDIQHEGLSDSVETINASVEELSNATRSTLSGRRPMWSDGDRIKVFTTDGKSAVYTYVASSATAGVATFARTSAESGYSLSNFAAAYFPADNVQSFNVSTNTVTATIPEVQDYVENSFDINAAPMASNQLITNSDGKTIQFANAFAVLRLNVYDNGGFKLSNVEITANSTYLTGDFSLTLTGNNQIEVAGPSSGGTKKVTLNTNGLIVGSTAADATVLNIVIPATTSEEVLESKFNYATTYSLFSITTNKTVSGIQANPLKQNSILNVSTREITAMVHYIEGPFDYGPGIEVGEAIWAPVNCGIGGLIEGECANQYPYGKLYQFGRKYGQAYELGDLEPVELTFQDGQSEGFRNEVGLSYIEVTDEYATRQYPNWYPVEFDVNLWNLGSEADPIKSEYDPCPEGWRVPTFRELYSLIVCDEDEGYPRVDSFVTYNGQRGHWFCGRYALDVLKPDSTTEYEGVFLPAAGFRGGEDGCVYNRGSYGDYMSSSVYFSDPEEILTYYPQYAYSFYVNKYCGFVDMYQRSSGHSVRCVYNGDNE